LLSFFYRANCAFFTEQSCAFLGSRVAIPVRPERETVEGFGAETLRQAQGEREILGLNKLRSCEERMMVVKLFQSKFALFLRSKFALFSGSRVAIPVRPEREAVEGFGAETLRQAQGERGS